MNELIEDYQRKINSVNELLKNKDNSMETLNRLNIKVGCYRAFLTDLKRALNIDIVILSDQQKKEEYDKGFCDGHNAGCEQIMDSSI